MFASSLSRYCSGCLQVAILGLSLQPSVGAFIQQRHFRRIVRAHRCEGTFAVRKPSCCSFRLATTQMYTPHASGTFTLLLCKGQPTKQKERDSRHALFPFSISTASLNKQLLLLLRQRLLIPGGRPCPSRPQQIQPNLDSVHQRRRLLHRLPKTLLELRPGIFNRFHRTG